MSTENERVSTDIDRHPPADESELEEAEDYTRLIGEIEKQIRDLYALLTNSNGEANTELSVPQFQEVCDVTVCIQQTVGELVREVCAVTKMVSSESFRAGESLAYHDESRLSQRVKYVASVYDFIEEIAHHVFSVSDSTSQKFAEDRIRVAVPRVVDLLDGQDMFETSN